MQLLRYVSHKPILGLIASGTVAQASNCCDSCSKRALPNITNERVSSIPRQFLNAQHPTSHRACTEVW